MTTAYLIAIVCVLLYVLYRVIRYRHTYWERNGIKSPETHPLYGNFKSLFKRKESVHELMEKIYNDYPKERVVGLYQAYVPVLFIRDPDLIKRVLIKDFAKFSDRGFKVTDEMLSKHMFTEDGDKWKILRQKFSPIFTSGKLKNMMPLLTRCVDEYAKFLEKLVGKELTCEVRDLNMRYTLKSITSIAFGLDIDTFYEDKSTFVEMARKLFEPNERQNIMLFINTLIPGILTNLPIRLSKEGVDEFFLNLVSEIVKQREGKPNLRRDLMDLLIEMKEQGTVTKALDDGTAELEITEAVMAAQTVLYYSAGFETSSGAMSYTLYELAFDQSAQERCYEEVKLVMDKYDGILTFDSLNELQYLTMSFEEALRKHPVVGFVFRQVVTDYYFPELNVKLKRGTKVMISPIGLHMDEAYFPNPEKFDPERFSPENRKNIRDCTYLAFGEGPRNCIGMRFAKVQSLLGLAHFLYRFRVTTCAETSTKITPDPLQITLVNTTGINLHIERR